MCKTITGDSTQKICVHIGKAHTINNAYLLNVRIFLIYFNFPFFFSSLCYVFLLFVLQNGMSLYNMNWNNLLLPWTLLSILLTGLVQTIFSQYNWHNHCESWKKILNLCQQTSHSFHELMTHEYIILILNHSNQLDPISTCSCLFRFDANYCDYIFFFSHCKLRIFHSFQNEYYVHENNNNNNNK